MDKTPVIGISSSVMIDESGMFPGYERAYVNKDYVDAILQNGGIPLIIPFNSAPECIEKQVAMIDGLVLSGGQDVFPLNYGEEPLQELGAVFPERDHYEYELVRRAMQKQLPILGICRGCQILNTALGGTLHQDLTTLTTVKKPIKHWQGYCPAMKTHSIVIEQHSLLHQVFGCDVTVVNSFHHQTIKTVAQPLTVTARAKDGVIEAVEHHDYRFMVGVQWHPEMLIHTCVAANQLFKRLIAAC